jgi:hypothetical protein
MVYLQQLGKHGYIYMYQYIQSLCAAVLDRRPNTCSVMKHTDDLLFTLQTLTSQCHVQLIIVCSQAFAVRKRFSTAWFNAYERLLVRMRSKVRRQMITRRKRFFTALLSTHKRLFAGVRAKVFDKNRTLYYINSYSRTQHATQNVRKCLVKALLVVNAFAHPCSVHTNGFAPVCVRKCEVKLPLCINALPQPGSAHTNGFSQVCVRK